MNERFEIAKAKRVNDLPMASRLRLIMLGSVKGSADGCKIRLERVFAKRLSRANWSIPFLFLGLFVPSIIVWSWINVGVFVAVWVLINLFVLSRAPLQHETG